MSPTRTSVIAIDEQSTVETCLSFVRDYHLLVGGSTGTVLAAVQKLAPSSGPATPSSPYLPTLATNIWTRYTIRPGSRMS